jgi:hypothetical protein
MKIATRGGENEVPREAAVGANVEVHPAHDRWMMGDRYGQIVRLDEAGNRVRVRLQTSGESLWFKPDDLMPARW